jgi:hypothetical protein
VNQAGSADYGHFYTFFKLRKKWFCFNDIGVQEWNQEDVFRFSLGIKMNGTIANSYCLFYSKSIYFFFDLKVF